MSEPVCSELAVDPDADIADTGKIERMKAATTSAVKRVPEVVWDILGSVVEGLLPF